MHWSSDFGDEIRTRNNPNLNNSIPSPHIVICVNGDGGSRPPRNQGAGECRGERSERSAVGQFLSSPHLDLVLQRNSARGEGSLLSSNHPHRTCRPMHEAATASDLRGARPARRSLSRVDSSARRCQRGTAMASREIGRAHV